MPASKIKAVFFDAGGTLLRPARPVGETYAALARNYGQHWDAALLHDGFNAAFKRARPRPEGEVSTNGDERLWWKGVVRDALSGVLVPETFPFDCYFEELYQAYARPELWRVFPETAPLLDQLRRRGLRLAVLSNWDSRLRALIEGLELSPFFDDVFISGELGAEKPSAKLYALALERLGLQPEEALMVGDDPINDYWAPQKAGWHAVLIERPHADLRSVLQWLEVK